MHPDKQRLSPGPGMVFFAVGLVFLILGITRQPALVGVGVALFVLGIVFMAKARTKDAGKDDAP